MRIEDDLATREPVRRYGDIGAGTVQCRTQNVSDDDTGSTAAHLFGKTRRVTLAVTSGAPSGTRYCRDAVTSRTIVGGRGAAAFSPIHEVVKARARCGGNAAAWPLINHRHCDRIA